MNYNLELKRNQGFPWFSYQEKIYVKGFIYDNQNKILKGFEFINFIKDKINLNILTNDFLNELNGSFTIISFQDEKVIVISDKLNSFPIFYKLSNNVFHISDEYEELVDSNSKLIQNNLDQFILAGYVLGNETVYNNISQTRGCEILTISKNNSSRKSYFYLVKSKDEDLGIDDYNKKYVEVIKNIGLRLVNGLEGRKVLLLLSAGFDSRIIANMLYQNDYKNVLAVTYGAKDSYEKEIAKKIADKLGFEWIFVEYSDEFLLKSIKKKQFNEFVKFSANGTTRPHIQDHFAIEYLLENNIIDNKTIVLNGNRPRINISDFHGTTEELLNFDLEKTVNQLANINFITKDKKLFIFLKSIITDNLCSGQPYDQMDDWNLKEYIGKYLFNLSRNYNFFGLEYRSPLLDKNFIDFIKDLPIHYKQDYKFFPKASKELIFSQTETDFSNSAYSGLKKNKIIEYMLSINWVKQFISNYLEKFIPKYQDPNNLKCVIEEIYPGYKKSNSREMWYNFNVSRWYIDKFIKQN